MRNGIQIPQSKLCMFFFDKKIEEECAKAMINMYNNICNHFTMNKTLPEGLYLRFVPGNGASRNGRRETQDLMHCL